MARSNNVLAVTGMLCVSSTFRTQFFANPRPTAEGLVGTLTDDELEQIDALGGYGTLPGGRSRGEFLDQAGQAFHNVSELYNCPLRPCPDGN